MIFRREEPTRDDESDQAPVNQPTPPGIPVQPSVAGQSVDEGMSAADLDSTGAQPSIVAAHTTWTGTLECNGSVQILGRLNGEIIATGDVYVAPGARVDARIRAINLTVAGELQGSITCDHRFEVLDSGNVKGQFYAPTLVIHDGATVNGQLRMTGSPDIDDEAVEDQPAPEA